MHWLIPVVSHSASCLYGLLGQSITPAALAVSVALVAGQSFHHWVGFYIIFAVFFLASNGLAIISRYTGNAKRNASRTAGYILANVALAAALVLVHQYYLTQRLKIVKWFIIERAPGGCLPIPSRSLVKPWMYKFHDAVANNLPWGIVASYTVAMANTFGSSLGSIRGLSIGNVCMGTLGALLGGITAACSLPFCDGTVDNAEDVMASVDRGPKWGERNPMEWSDEARYRALPAVVTVVGVIGMVIASFISSNLKGSGTAAQKPKQANGRMPNGKQASKSDDESELGGTGDLASFLTNAFVTIGVVLGMAVWSYVGYGPRTEETPGIPGFTPDL